MWRAFSFLIWVLAAVLPCRLVHAVEPEALAGRIDAIRREHGVASASLVLVERERMLLHRTFGIADRRSGVAADNDTRYKVGSISKVFTGLALLRAEAKGLLRLDQPVRVLAPQASFDNPWEARRPLTVAMLMEHTTGWFDMSRAEFDHPAKHPIPLAEALAVQPQSRVSHWPPGLFSEYSNSGPGLAGYVLEQVADMPFERFLEREVFRPLGMTSASFLPDAETLEHLAQGYDRDGRTPIPYWHILYRPAGGLNLNPRDMAPFLRMLLGRGELDGRVFLAPERIDRMERPRTTAAARAGLEYGYGLGVQASLHRGHVLYTHGGDGDGYLARFAYSLETGRGCFVVITAFNHAPLMAMREALSDWLVEGLPAPAPLPEFAVPAEVLARYAGRYLAATTRFPRPGWRGKTLEVFVDDGRIHTRTEGDRARPLVAVGERLFRRPREPVATTAFTVLEDGSVALQGPFGNWLKPASP